jgi:aspartyl-tRNA(Asn)/glutamyl-tRNA(Gln) amidotransferase subunit B
MQEGSFRCDANVSVRLSGTQELGTRAEIKNLNSFRFLERAINFEVERQIDIIEGGGEVVQETRLYDADRDETRSMRSKEEANDYRYFPDPDLLPVEVEDSLIESLREQLPELPDARCARFISEHKLPAYDAGVLTADKATADFFEAVLTRSGAPSKTVSSWVTGELFSRLNKEGLELPESPVDEQRFSGLVARIHDNTISGKIGKEILDKMWASDDDADQIIEREGLKQISDSSELEKMVDDVIEANPAQLAEYRAGKEKLLAYFVGQVMKASRGKANPGQLNQLLKEKLKG